MMSVINENPTLQRIADEALDYVRKGKMFEGGWLNNNPEYAGDSEYMKYFLKILGNIDEALDGKGELCEQVAMLESLVLNQYVIRDKK